MNRAALLPFQYEIVQELNASDALCIVASGIGWTKPVSVFLRAHTVEPNGGAVVLLGCSESQKEALEAELRRDNHPSAEMPVDLNRGNVSALARLAHYNAGRCCYATPRIFVDDLLAQKIRPDVFAGLFVFNAEQVSDNSGVEFAIRLYRLGNTTGFVRAFSDQPMAFAIGFTKAEKVMKALQVRCLSLWPRFQTTVKADLERTPIQVTEITQPLTSAMSSIQDSIRDLMMALVDELKKMGTIDCSEMTVESCLFTSFDEMVQRQLNSVWATVSWKTKQLVSDLKELRNVLLALMTRDAVDFLYYLETIRMTCENSIWQFHDAAHDVFEQAKKRVFVLDFKDDANPPEDKKRKTRGVVTGRRAYLRPVLEPLPKWAALKDLLSEIQQEIQNGVKDKGEAEKSVLVVCKEMFLKNQLKWAIQDPEKLLKNLFHGYLALSRQMRDQNVTTRRRKKQPAALKCDFSLYVRSELNESLPLMNIAATPVEDVALETTLEELPPSLRPKKKRLIQQQQQKSSDDETEDRDEEASDETRRATGSLLYTEEAWEEVDQSNLLHHVHFYALDAMDDSILWKVRPDYVIFYHLDVAFLRQVELFQAENLEKQVKLYLIYYDNSIEKTTFTTAIQRETDIFSGLIENKEHITIPQDIGERQDLPLEKRQAAIETRSGKKIVPRQDRDKRHKIVVDMREFMSKLPATLHRAKFELRPVTLEVGDYILTPDIVVERKTIPDLHSSIKSGRLYHQAEAMSKQWEIPMLLIEFDGGRQFRLQSDFEIGKEISSKNIISRLVLLILHFPTLRLVWSPSAQTTCRIFDKLKRNRTEPDHVIVEKRGRKKTVEVNNEKAIDILRKMPGVTETNCRRLIKSCRSLNDLAKCSLVQLEKWMGSKKNAKALHSFLQAPCPRQ